MLLKGRFQILKGYQNNHVTIGFGSYGKVKLARDLLTGSTVAVKVINKIAKNQIAMHNRLSHPNIIRLIDVHIDTEREITYMILEYAEAGTLFQKIKMESVPKTDIRKYFKDVCEALAYLHQQSIMHRDIKPENVLLTKGGQAKLCDFGFASLLGERKTLCGTYEYMSPEMIQNKPYDLKIDIWALGILLFQLIAGHAPFRGDKPQDVLQKMKTKIYFCQRFEPEDINLIKMILRVTPQKRPTICEILEQPFFKIFDNKNSPTKSISNNFDSRIKIASMPFLNGSCSPKKMNQIQKAFQKEHQKQTYPPFYIPKRRHKFEVGVTMNPSEQKSQKDSSPPNELKNLNISSTLPNPNSYIKQLSQIPVVGFNKKFYALSFSNKSPACQLDSMSKESDSNTSTPPHPMNTAKSNGKLNLVYGPES